VVLVHNGEVTAVGMHRELVHTEPRYRAVVTRETEDESALSGALEEDEVPNEDARSEDALHEDVLNELEEIEETA
jgi:glutamate synthase domain-containing protein 1